MWAWTLDENNTTIISNKNKEGFFIPELKEFDFLILFSKTPLKYRETLINELKKTKEYILLQKIETEQILKLKNKYILACF